MLSPKDKEMRTGNTENVLHNVGEKQMRDGNTNLQKLNSEQKSVYKEDEGTKLLLVN